jgi:hypothetical protein
MVFLRSLAVTAIIGGVLTFAGGTFSVWATGQNWQYSCAVPPDGAAGTVDNPQVSYRMTLLPLGVSCIWWMSDGSSFELPPRDWTYTVVVYGAMVTVAAAIGTLVVTRNRLK